MKLGWGKDPERKKVEAEVEREVFLDKLDCAKLDMDERQKVLIEQVREARERGNEEQLIEALVHLDELIQDKEELNAHRTSIIAQMQTSDMDGIREGAARLSKKSAEQHKKAHEKIDYSKQAEDAVTNRVIDREQQAGKKLVNRVAGSAQRIKNMSPERLNSLLGLVDAQDKVTIHKETDSLKRAQAALAQKGVNKEEKKDKE